MTMFEKVLAAASLAALMSLSRSARADVPGPKPVCASESLPECKVCWQSYGRDTGPFEQCAAPLRDKGLVEACRNRQGAGDNVWFCPSGTKMETKVTGGGCAGCAVSGEGGAYGLALAAAACAVAALRRRATTKAKA